MREIKVNKFNTLEFEPHKINEVNDKDRYFDVYLKSRKKEKELVAEMKISLSDPKKSKVTIKKKGDVLHPKVLLTMNDYMNKYKDD